MRTSRSSTEGRRTCHLAGSPDTENPPVLIRWESDENLDTPATHFLCITLVEVRLASAQGWLRGRLVVNVGKGHVGCTWPTQALRTHSHHARLFQDNLGHL